MIMRRRQFTQRLFLFSTAIASGSFLKSCKKETSSTASDPALKELSFGILTTELATDLEPKWNPFLEAMSAAIGLPVKPFFATQYSSLIEAMRADAIQIAWFGGKTYIEAAKLANASAFVSTISDTGDKGYYAHLITHGDRPWLEEAKDVNKLQYLLDRNNAQKLSFAFNDVNSTSGYLVPMYYIFAENSIDPLQHFKQVSFLGSHEATVAAVVEQRVDIATNNSEGLARFQEKFPDQYQDIRIVWTSTLIPSDPIAYDSELPEALKQAIQDFFLTYKDKVVLNNLNWSGFDLATDQDWDPIRELNIGKQILEIQQNEAIADTEKQNILEGLQQQLDQLRTKSAP